MKIWTTAAGLELQSLRDSNAEKDSSAETDKCESARLTVRLWAQHLARGLHRSAPPSWAPPPQAEGFFVLKDMLLYNPRLSCMLLRSSCGWQMLRFHGQVCSCAVCALSRLLCCRPNAEAECCSSMNQRSRTQKNLNAFRSRSS